jgi:hypothetical protein
MVPPLAPSFSPRPKKASGVESDLDQRAVRRYEMDRGLVEFKVAAVDTTWSGLRFSRKKP